MTVTRKTARDIPLRKSTHGQSLSQADIWTTEEVVMNIDPAIWIKDDLGNFLDHWIIVRTDGLPILNGTPEEFEKQLRDLINGKEKN